MNVVSPDAVRNYVVQQTGRSPNLVDRIFASEDLYLGSLNVMVPFGDEKTSSVNQTVDLDQLVDFLASEQGINREDSYAVLSAELDYLILAGIGAAA